MAVNPKSLSNLQPGARKGIKYKVTKGFLENLVRELEKRLPDALYALDQLPPKEYLVAYTKLADRFMPKPEAEKAEAEQKALTFITQLIGNEHPLPLLDISQLQKYDNNSQDLSKLVKNTPVATDDNEGIIEI